MYKEVAYADGSFVAKGNAGNKVVIEKSISQLYTLTNHPNGSQSFEPITFTQIATLMAIHDLLMGHVTDGQIKLLNHIYIRYGWLDKRLNSLHWVSLLELHRRFCAGQEHPTDKSKIAYLGKILSIARRDMVRVLPQDQLEVRSQPLLHKTTHYSQQVH